MPPPGNWCHSVSPIGWRFISWIKRAKSARRASGLRLRPHHNGALRRSIHSRSQSCEFTGVAHHSCRCWHASRRVSTRRRTSAYATSYGCAVPHSGQNFATAPYWLAAVEAELRFRASYWAMLRSAQGRRSRCGRRRRRILAGPQRVRHDVGHGQPAPRPTPKSGDAPLVVCSSDGQRIRHLILRVLVHIAQHVHADARIEHLLQFVRQRRFSTTKLSSVRPRSVNMGASPRQFRA